MSKRRRRHDASRVVASYRHAASYGDRVLRGGESQATCSAGAEQLPARRGQRLAPGGHLEVDVVRCRRGP
jgi:hypothetical protein